MQKIETFSSDVHSFYRNFDYHSFSSQIRHPYDETQCLTCQKGTIPDRFKEYCQDIPEQYLRLESGWAIGAMAFSSIGMLITFFVVCVFLR